MSPAIPPLSSPALPEAANGPGSSAANAASAASAKGNTASASAGSAASTAQTDSVSLSAAARTSTQLLNAARNAQGVDQATVSKIRTALANGQYNVAPEDLAHAIATVLKDTKP